MKTAHCIFDPTIVIDFDTIIEKDGNMSKAKYCGPRQIVCSYPSNCANCGWNPEEEKRRKENGLHKRNGYIYLDNIPADTLHIYRAFSKKKEEHNG